MTASKRTGDARGIGQRGCTPCSRNQRVRPDARLGPSKRPTGQWPRDRPPAVNSWLVQRRSRRTFPDRENQGATDSTHLLRQSLTSRRKASQSLSRMSQPSLQLLGSASCSRSYCLRAATAHLRHRPDARIRHQAVIGCRSRCPNTGHFYRLPIKMPQYGIFP